MNHNKKLKDLRRSFFAAEIFIFCIKKEKNDRSRSQSK